MAGLDCRPTTEQNLQRGADSLRHVQGTTLGIKHSSPEYQAGDLEFLRSLWKVLRGAVTRLLKAATELWQALSPSPSDLLEAISELIRRDGELSDLNMMIADLLDGQEFEEEIEGSLRFHDEVLHKISRSRCILNEKYGLPTKITRVPMLVAGNGEDFASTVGLREMKTEPVELNIAQAPEEARIEPPPCECENIFVPDFRNGESMPEFLETRLAPIVEVQEVAAMRESQSLPIPEVVKAEQPLLITSDSCEETARPGRESAVLYIESTSTTKRKPSALETTETKTGPFTGRPKTDQR